MDEELARLAQAARHSTLPGAHLFDGITLDNWHAALRQMASALPDGPAIVVLDEFPWWTRTGSVEVDLVGVDQWPGVGRVTAVGSIKWRDRSPFDQRDLADLAAHCAEVPGGREPVDRGEPLRLHGSGSGGGLRSRRPGVRLALRQRPSPP